MNYQSPPLVASELVDREPKLDAHDFVLQSFSRAIAGAPVESRRKVFRIIATDSFRRCCADLWDLAHESGLVELVGEVTVTDDLVASFGGQL
jgi:hypothetical protein